MRSSTSECERKRPAMISAISRGARCSVADRFMATVVARSPQAVFFGTSSTSAGKVVSFRSPDARASSRASRNVERTEKDRSEEHTSELQSQSNLVCRLLLEKKKGGSTARSIDACQQRRVGACTDVPDGKLQEIHGCAGDSSTAPRLGQPNTPTAEDRVAALG